MDTEFKVGDRVMVKNDYREEFARGQMATIRYDDGTGVRQYLIEFDNEFPACHTGDGQCRDNHGWWIDGEWLQPIERIKLGIYKKENKEMYCVNEPSIIDLYFDNENSKISKKYSEKERKLMKKDGVIAQVEAFKAQMKDVKGLKIEYKYELPREIKEQREKLSVACDHEIVVLRDKCREIKTMVAECETYEQKQAILKAYNIIDEQGKLIK